MLKVGIAGLRRGRALLRVFHQHPGVAVAAVCDPDPDRRQQVATEFGITAAYGEFAELLAADIDAIVVATPAPLHAGQAIQALEAGAHVMSEVPAAWTLDECAALAAAVARSGRVYMMAENMNFFHYIMEWKRRVRGGEIGRVFYAEAEYIHDCRGIMREAGGQLAWRASMPPIHYCTHSLGPLLDILDDRCVSAVGMDTGSHTAADIGATDMEVGLFRTARGRVLKVLCGFAVAREPALHWQVFYGTEGTLENRRVEGEAAKLFKSGGMEEVAATVSDPDAPPQALAGGHGTSEFHMVDGFVRAVLDGAPPPIDIYRSLDFTAPGLCAHLSARQGGAPVAVPDYRGYS